MIMPTGRAHGVFGEVDALVKEMLVRAVSLPEAWPAIERLAWSFWRAEAPHPLDETRSWRRMLEWAIFAVRLPPDGTLLADRVIDAAADLSDDEREVLLRLRPRWSIYHTVRSIPHVGQIMKDAVVHDRILVRMLHDTDWLDSRCPAVGSLFPVGGDEYVPGASFFRLEGDDPDQEDEVCEDEDEVEAFRLALGPVLESVAGTDWIAELETLDDVRYFWEAFREKLLSTGTPLFAFDDLCGFMRDGNPDLNADDVFGDLDDLWWTHFEPEIAGAMIHRTAMLLGRKPHEA